MPSSPQAPPSSASAAPPSAVAIPPRKSHAGWKLCRRCNDTVSSNGRNFIHHMAKCDPVFYAQPLAAFEARKAAAASGAPKAKRRRPSRATLPRPDPGPPHARTTSSTPPPPPPPRPPSPRDYPYADTAPYASSSPITPHVGAAAPPTPLVTPRVRASSDTFASSLNASAASSGDRVALTDAQRSSFVQQLCFLRTYDGAIDAAFDRLERACGGQWGVFNADIFDEMQRCQAAAACAPHDSGHHAREERPPEATVVRDVPAWAQGAPEREREAEQGNLMHFANAVADVDRHYWPGEVVAAPEAAANQSMNLRHVMD